MRSLLALVFAGFAVTAASAAPSVHEGLWEYAIKMDLPMGPGPMKQTQCVTQKDLVPRPPQANCKTTASKVSGDTATWTAQCKQGDMTMESSGTVTYRADSMQGNIKTSMNMGGRTHTTTSTISGRRLGPCK